MFYEKDTGYSYDKKKNNRKFTNVILKNLSQPATLVSGILLLLIALCAIFAPLIAPTNPYDLAVVSIMDGRLAPGETMFDGTVAWLGTDGAGRDVLSAIIYGLRTSLTVAVCSALIALTIGLLVGMTAAFFGGRVDAFLMRIVDIQLSFPAILVALVLLALLGKGIDKVIIALAIVQWAIYARTVRASAIVERRKEYIEAANCLGLSSFRIIWKHLLPNSISPLIVLATLQTAHSISIEATLSFLGVGVPITEPSLGSLIANGFDYILSGAYWITFFPGIMLLATVAAINIFGDHLRVLLNPRLSK
jgi:peptide/nickel transport system permease protein